MALVILCCILYGRYKCNQKERSQIRQGRSHVAVCECQVVHAAAFSVTFLANFQNYDMKDLVNYYD